jgi:hypothetical protein
VVEKVRERLAVRKQEAQRFYGERFNLRKLNDLEVKEQYQTEITNRFGRILKRMSKPQLKRVWVCTN